MNAWPLTLLPLMLLGSCSLQQRVDKTMAKVEDAYAASKTWEELPLRTISWNQAVAMMLAGNIDMVRQRDNIRESERSELSVYTQMIPGVTYYSYFTSNLRDLTNQVNRDKLSSTINVNFSIPTLTQIPYNVYASKASTYAQIKALEGKERELVSSLYKLVRTKELEEAKDALQARLEPSQQDKKPDDKRPRSNKQNNWGEISRLLGNSEARWVVLPETMPHVRWENYESRLDKLDPLIVCQFAMRLEQARMSQYNVALRYIPTLNTSLYSPSLFNSSGGNYSGTFLNSKDTTLNLSLSYSLDTDMDNWNSYARSKARYEQTKQEVAGQLMEYRNKLSLLRSSYSEYTLWKAFMAKRMEFLRNTPPTSAESFLERRKELISMEKEMLNQEGQAIETEAALILQYGLLEK